MVRKQKRPFLLIEVLIAISLIALLSTLLFMALRQIVTWSRLNESELQKEEAVSNAHQTLARVFSHAQMEGLQNSSESSVKEQRFFFTENANSLVFTFNNGVDRDPRFSNVVLGKIFLDSSNCLCLAIRPLPSRWKNFSPADIRKEILLENVSAVHFIFYHPPERSPLDVQPKEVQTGKIKKHPLPGEQHEWLQEYGSLPRIVKLVVVQNREEAPIVFSYHLPAASQTILIREGKR